MRENAAIDERPHSQKASPVALVPIAIVALSVLLLALLVSGNQRGTIVAQRITFTAMTIQNTRTEHPAPFVVTSIAETSADGTLQRSYTSNSFTRPGYQEVMVGSTLQLYDPADNTIYVTTQQAQQRAIIAQVRRTAPKGAHISVGTASLSSESYSPSPPASVPARTSVFERLLRSGQYRLAGRTTIDGRAALKLVQTRTTVLPLAPQHGRLQSLATVYVAPRSYDPIEEIVRSTLPGLTTSVVSRWQSYRVLPATAANQRLLSLTARHPSARVVRNARAYLLASQSETRTTTQA